MQRNRLRLAYICSPIIPTVLFSVLFSIDEPRLLVFMLVFSIPFSYLPCLLLGMPYINFLKSRNRFNIVSLMAGGTLIGSLAFYAFGIVFSSVLGSPRSLTPMPNELLAGACLGFLVAVVFGLIAGLPFITKK